MVNFTVASSNFSEGISRQNITPSRSACRNLFGTVDHDEIREEERKQNIERLREKRFEYNFDFEKGTPLEGRYVWERVPNIANRYENRSGRGTAEEENGSGTTDSQITEISTKKHLPTSQPIEQKITGKLYVSISKCSTNR